MSQAPYMPLFTDALLGDTTHLTAEEFGSYCLLLFATWQNNGVPFPDEDSRLRRIVRCTPRKWARLRAVLVQFFDLSDGSWRQKRLEKQWRRTSDLLAAQREKSAQGVAVRRPKSDPIGDNIWIPKKQANDLKSLKTDQPAGSPSKSKGETKEEVSFKILEGAGVAALPAAEPDPAAEPEPVASSVAPPTPEHIAEVDALVEQATAALKGTVPRGIRDPVAYQAVVKANKLTHLVKNINAWAGTALAGEARMAAWEVLAEAESAGARSGMTAAARKDFDRLDAMFRATGPPGDLEQAA